MRVVAHLVSPTVRRVAPAVLLLTALAGCLDLKATPDACTVTVAPTTLTLAINRSAPIVGTAFDCKGNSIAKKKISFSSSNPTVATVAIDGTVLAISVGTASISAVADGKSSSVQVTVTPEQAATVTVTPGVLTLRKGNVRQLTATARTNQQVAIPGRTFRWLSSNSAVASVDQSGNVTALAAGQAVISAETDLIVGTASITITEVPIQSCSLTPTSFKVTVGQTVQPTLTLRDTANQVIPTLGRPIAWTSSSEAVATIISNNGAARTGRAGTATIFASSVEYPAVSCTSVVEAVDPRIDKVIIQQRTGSLRLGIPRGFTVALLDSVSGNIPPGRVVTWSTSTPTVVQVTQAGIVTGISLGTARIIATAEGVADTVSLQVTKVPVTSVSLTPVQVALFEGQTIQFRATVTDSTGTEVTDRTIEWLTSDPTRASVSTSGLATAIASGSVVVSAVSENRVGQAQMAILPTPVDTIIAPPTFTLKVQTQSAFAITLRDAAGNTIRNRNVIVTSDDPGTVQGVANALANQVVVSAIKVGSATLTIQALNNNGQPDGKPAVVTVTITP
ncbi:MAG: Ig-like domain-containing protein [Gemmatimonadetes bacterium]|nr:Ig-like domain-containing protein [Gemmatimonadota bacterium]